eukprot:jgi/Chlat1/2127/Chrsp17S02707
MRGMVRVSGLVAAPWALRAGFGGCGARLTTKARTMRGSRQAACRPFASLSEAARASFVSPSEAATAALARQLASQAAAGDTICLYGCVGAGKSVFSRNFIRAIAGDPDMVVPSPTFLLQQIYDDHAGPPVHHFDLYRLTGPDDFDRLGLQDSITSAVCLFEWAERLGPVAPEDRLDLHIEVDLDDVLQPVAQESARTHQEQGGTDVESYEEDYADRGVRIMHLSAYGHRWQQLVHQLEQHVLASRADLAGLCSLSQALQAKA